MSLESLKPFRIPKKNTRHCHEGQRKVLLSSNLGNNTIQIRLQNDAHLPTMHPQMIEQPFVQWLIFICTLVICMLIFTLTIASDAGCKSTEADVECPH